MAAIDRGVPALDAPARLLEPYAIAAGMDPTVKEAYATTLGALHKKLKG